MKNTHVWFLLLLLFTKVLVAQPQKPIKFKKTTSGLEYAIIKKGQGKKAKIGNRIFLNYFSRIKLDSIFDSNNNKYPYSFILGQGDVLKGWDEGIALLSEGDSAVFRIPPQLAFGEKKIAKIPSNTTFLLEVKILKVEEAFYDGKQKDTVQLALGLKKILIKSSTGKPARSFMGVTLNYTGYYINDKKQKRIFESSYVTGLPASFQLGTERFLKGLDIGIAGMKIGEKSIFILSPEMSYGTKPAGEVPLGAIVYFDIELLAVNNPFFDASGKDTIKTKSGLAIIVIDPGAGPLINKGNYITMHYTGFLKNGEGNKIIFDNTIERKQPVVFRPNSPNLLKGWTEASLLLRKGAKAILIIPPQLAYGDIELSRVPKNSTVFFDIEITNVSEPFFNVTNKDTVTLSSGLKYIVAAYGDGVLPNPIKAFTGKVVVVNYVGFILDSLRKPIVFDTSIERGNPLEFKLGAGKVIKGMEEGVLGMHMGEKRRLIIPGNLGYAEKGIPPLIPSDATLYFDIELVKVLK